MITVCPTCNQPIPLKINVRERFVFRGDVRTRLTESEFLIFTTLYYNGQIATTIVMDVLYEDDEDGGPELGVGALNVFVAHMNVKLAPLKAAIISPRQHYREIVDVA